MKKSLALLGLLSALSFTSSAQASAVYHFSYTFAELGAGDVVTGSFTGDANGNLISNLSNISVSANGTPFNGSGNLIGRSWTGTNWVSGSAIVSFDGSQNNFAFTDDDYDYGPNYTNYFLSINLFGDYDTVLFTSWSSPYSQDYGMFNTQSWSVTVPEPSSSALLGLALAGLAAARRNRNS